MTLLIKILIVIVVVAIALIGIIYWWSRPAFSEKEFPQMGVVQYNKFADRIRAAQPRQITVIAYNMGYASAEKDRQPVRLTHEEVQRNLDSIAQELKTVDADIILLQEIDFEAHRTHNIDQMGYLARALRMPYGAYAVTWNMRYVPWPYWPPKVHYGRMLSGKAVLSRFPLDEVSVIPFAKPKANPFWYNLFYLNRLVQRVEVTIGGEKRSIWNVHLEAFDADTRREQLSIFADALNKDPKPLIAAGDYNEREATVLNSFGEKTKLKRFGVNIDCIFYPEQLVLENSGSLKSDSLDHVPVWATFHLR